jgi:hypothetical protein
MNRPIICLYGQLDLDEFHATSAQAETVELALRNYGHLIKTVMLSRCSFAALAERIEQVYDCEDNVRNRTVVETLREVHAMNEVEEMAA